MYRNSFSIIVRANSIYSLNENISSSPSYGDLASYKVMKAKDLWQLAAVLLSS